MAHRKTVNPPPRKARMKKANTNHGARLMTAASRAGGIVRLREFEQCVHRQTSLPFRLMSVGHLADRGQTYGELVVGRWILLRGQAQLDRGSHEMDCTQGV